jgi:hypothetical protein
MDRRSFFTTIAKAAAAFAVLPAATTYARSWKPLPSGLLVPEGEEVMWRLIKVWIPMPLLHWDNSTLFVPGSTMESFGAAPPLNNSIKQ